MPSIISTGEKINIVDIFEMLPPWEGEIDIFYGRIGSGKTSAGTRNIIRELKAGQIIYANWNLKWEGYDERKDWKILLMKIICFWSDDFMRIPKENFHFWNFVEGTIDGKPYKEYFNLPKDFLFQDLKGNVVPMGFVDVLSRIADARIHLDEGHIPFDSYEAARMDEKKRSAVFGMRHFDRGLCVYTQRAMSVHINLRGNTNRFFKCEKIFDLTIFRKRFIKFLITEFQDTDSAGVPDEKRLKDEDGNETGEYMLAVSSEEYWGTKKHFAMFDSKYLRGNLKRSQPNTAEFYSLTWKEKWRNLLGRNKSRNV